MNILFGSAYKYEQKRSEGNDTKTRFREANVLVIATALSYYKSRLVMLSKIIRPTYVINLFTEVSNPRAQPQSPPSYSYT